jgi:hypothetical protein
MMHAHRGTAGRGARWGSWAASWPEELRYSEGSHGYQQDEMTVCFQSSQQVAFDDSERTILNLLLLNSE